MKNEPCPLCGRKSLKPCRDYKGEFLYCTDCQVAYRHVNHHQITEQTSYYNRDWLEDQLNSAYVRQRCQAITDQVLGKLQPGAKVLDVGSGHGLTVKMLREGGLEAMGIDINPGSVAFSNEKWGNYFSYILPPNCWYDGVVMAFVLEHLIDPVGFLTGYRDCLNAGGYIFAVVPDLSIYHPGSLLWGYFPELFNPDHMVAFTPGGMVRLFKKAGLEVDGVYSLAVGGLNFKYWLHSIYRYLKRGNTPLPYNMGADVPADEKNAAKSIYSGFSPFIDWLATTLDGYYEITGNGVFIFTVGRKV